MNGDTWRANVTWEHNLLMEENMQLLRERQRIRECYIQMDAARKAWQLDCGFRVFPPYGFHWDAMLFWERMLFDELKAMAAKEIRR